VSDVLSFFNYGMLLLIGVNILRFLPEPTHEDYQQMSWPRFLPMKKYLARISHDAGGARKLVRGSLGVAIVLSRQPRSKGLGVSCEYFTLDFA
jgi:hypothetical protein